MSTTPREQKLLVHLASEEISFITDIQTEGFSTHAHEGKTEDLCWTGPCWVTSVVMDEVLMTSLFCTWLILVTMGGFKMKVISLSLIRGGHCGKV